MDVLLATDLVHEAVVGDGQPQFAERPRKHGIYPKPESKKYIVQAAALGK